MLLVFLSFVYKVMVYKVTKLSCTLSDPRIRTLGEAKVKNMKEWWDLKLENAIEAASKEDGNDHPSRIVGGM